MTIRNKKISQVRFDKSNVDAPTINRALDNVINPLNSFIDDATQAINELQANQSSGGGTITINPENAASITANNINLNGAGGITYASNGSDTITIYQQPISVAANGTAGTGTGNSITINGTSGITATRSGTTITLAGSPSSITLNADTGSITGDVFNILADGCCIHTETSGSDTLIISSSAPCEFTNGDGNIEITIPSNIVISGSNVNTIALGHFNSSPTFLTDEGMAGQYGGISYYISTGVGYAASPSKFGSGSMTHAGNVGGNVGLQVQFYAATGALGTPYLQNADGLTGDFTYEFWVNPVYTTTYGFQGLAQIGQLPYVSYNSLSLWMYLGQLHFGLQGAAQPTGHYLTAGVWSAIAICRSGNTIRLFVNGNLIYTMPGVPNLGTGANLLILGYTYDMYPSYGGAQGWYDEMRFSNVALYTASYTPATSEFGDYSGVASLVTDYCERQFDFADNLVISASITSPIVSGSQGRFSQMTSSYYTGSSAAIGSVTSNTFTGGTYTGSLATINTITASYYSGSNAQINTITGSTFTGSLAIINTITASNISASNNIIAPAITGSEISSSNFIGWGNRIVRPYGSFCDLTTQTASATTTAYPMRFTTTEEALGVSIVSGSHITFDYAGTYNIQFSAQVIKSNASNANIDIWLAETGSNVPRSNTTLHIQGNGAAVVAAWNFVRTFASGSYAEILWRTDDTNVELLYQNSSSSPDRPEIPSTILTISQV